METIETERLRIRRLRDEDLDGLYEVCGDPELMRYVGDGRPLTREQTRRWIEKSQGNYERHGFGCAAVVLKDGGRFAGYCGLVYGHGGADVEIIYALKREFRGAGLAGEAARAVIEYGFAECGLSRIVATIDPANAASVRVADKLGMTHREDRLDEHGLPEAVYAVDRTDYGEVRAGGAGA
ncbi:MAG TPA: GNAT family N-acetyltransferase [Pyrinomonadaceae bacterium]|nr:GNAT family N-acetyltransferase [Pyrinomonadaceae bacterium]